MSGTRGSQHFGLLLVAKIIEISCESPKSFEDAIQDGIAKASKTEHNIKSAWVKEQQANLGICFLHESLMGQKIETSWMTLRRWLRRYECSYLMHIPHSREAVTRCFCQRCGFPVNRASR